MTAVVIGRLRAAWETFASGRLRAVSVISLWAVVAGVTAVLALQRVRHAVGDTTAGAGVDLGTFLDGARAAAEQGTPYAAEGYVYSPLLALALRSVEGPALAQMGWWTVLSLAAGVVAVGLVLASVWDELGPLSRPVVAGVAVITLLYSWPVATIVGFGQVDLFLLMLVALAVLLTARGRPGAAGFVVGLAAALKTWAGGLALWGFRRGAGQWRATLVGVGTALAAVVVVSGLAVGWHSIPQWVERTVSAGNQPLTSYSAFGAGRDLFTSSGVLAGPIVESDIMSVMVTLVLIVWVAGLLVLALLRPGDARIAAWNTMACLLLLLPVSHLAYRVLALPILWVWLSLGRRIGRAPWLGAVLVLGLCWYAGYRQILGNAGGVDPVSYLTVLGAAYVSTTLSTVLAARLGPARSSAEALPERVVAR
jgi:hypothetical protein